MHGTLMFFLFLAAFACWVFLAFRAGQIVRHIPIAGIPFWNSEMMVLPGVIGFLGFIYLLSGFWNWELALIMVASVHLSPLAGWFLTNAFGKNAARGTARQFWMGLEIGAHSPRLVSNTFQLIAFIAFSYPFVAGYIFFHHPWGSAVLEDQEIKCTLLLLTLSSYLATAIIVPKMLTSENLDEDTRQNLFFSQLAGLIPTAAYGAIGVSAFGFNPNSIGFEAFGGLNRIVSLGLLGILCAFFAGTVLIPYLVGIQRGRVKEIGFLEQIKALVVEVEDVLETPLGAAHSTKLDELVERITTMSQQFLSGEQILSLYNAISLDPAKANEDQKRLKEAIDDTGDLDGRFCFLNELTRLKAELPEISSNLRMRTPSDADDAAAKWARRYESRKAELQQKIDDRSSHKPIVAAGLGSGVVIIVSGILGEVAKTAWSLLSHGR
jgi:hypothetical protein